MPRPLNQFSYSLEHGELLQSLASQRRLLIIQDLDGVCMGLVRDPRQRSMDPRYIEACKQMAGRFYVLTNGEHIGSRGVNSIVESVFAASEPGRARELGLYLPGLAAGGVQFQDCFGRISHPGVSDREMAFLAEVPAILHQRLGEILAAPPFALPAADIEHLLAVAVLDNAVSPTLNIGVLHSHFAAAPARYREVQDTAAALMDELLALAQQRGLGESFFVHLAPNLGSDANGRERLKPATSSDMGTTDFQFMLRGAIKEVGVLVLLNDYYYIQTGEYPLGEGFNARNAPHSREALLALAEGAFDPALMPSLVGVGDTLTSNPQSDNGSVSYSRGGSDRGFLTLVQALGQRMGSDSAVLFVDSSGGELDRPGVHPPPAADAVSVSLDALASITDPGDPLHLNAIFPGGHQQYAAFFIALAQRCAANAD
ncbi:glucosylglycerol 3-phosphatase [Mangrovimicrobium sediminis]|uniref:Glucosylglycerol 3-phosphatase n=1 Tax=Mangrovimicrobium sediminis TaxID=2562682 RepID=A0A4Z0LYY4_9GAMM|nr:glucosylglycerol 3-phosphatase [Haliea sp. SAOS-164]TGD72593.1 glucosylglycerol 3-phosphatase [Haliea sp. SAOS-164]